MRGINVDKFGEIVGVGLVLFVFLTIGPLLVIWSVNTLFPAMSIAYTFWTWLATFFIMIAFGHKGAKK